MLRSIFFPAFFFLIISANAQTVSIPGYTGYAVPAEKDESLFSEKNGGLHWSDAKQTISYSFYIRKAGDLAIAINTKNATAGNAVKLSVAGKEFCIEYSCIQRI
jgi:hypothetical protein